jgi:sugar phosphate isomerase/epimerase
MLDGLGSNGLAASIDPASLLSRGYDPAATTRELGPWVAHAYANDPGASQATLAAAPGGRGVPPGALDWEGYLGALEEINYRGFLTIWPDPSQDAAARFKALAEMLKRF